MQNRLHHCDECSRTFKTRLDAERHQNAAHDGYPCPNCDLRFETRELQKRHTDLCCSVCGRLFTSIQDKWQHTMQAHHIPEVQDRLVGGVRYVVTRPLLDEAVEHLSSEDIIAIDAEYFHGEQLCLLQLASASRSYVIDCLALGEDLWPLVPLMANPTILKVGHSFFINDKEKLSMFKFAGLRDTQVLHYMMTSHKYARLADLLRSYNIGNKDTTMGSSNWAVRPLSDSQILYAGKDAQDLIRLHQAMELQHGDMAEYVRTCDDMCTRVTKFEPPRRR